jgi:hypothetical protein
MNSFSSLRVRRLLFFYNKIARWRREGGGHIPRTPSVGFGRWTSPQGPHGPMEGWCLFLLRLWHPSSTSLLFAVVHSNCHGPGHGEDEPHVARSSRARGCDPQHVQGCGGHRGCLYGVLHRSGDCWCPVRVQPSQLHLGSPLRWIFGLYRLGNLGPHEDPR